MKKIEPLLWAKRLLVYLLGLFFMAAGVVFSVKSGLGVSPVTGLANVVSQISGLTMGVCTTLTYCAYIVVEFLILRRDFKPTMLLQIAASFLFGFMVTLATEVLSFVPAPEAYPLRLLYLAVSVPLVAFGVMLYLAPQILPTPGDGLPLAISKKTGKPVGTCKIISDCCLVAVSALVSLVFLHRLAGVREGTVVSALTVGFVMKRMMRLMQPRLLAFVGRESKLERAIKAEALPPAQSRSGKLIITISREFGSDGYEIGRLLAEKLGVPFYDRQLIAMEAAESGLSESFIEAHEQSMARGAVYDFLTSGYAMHSEGLSPLERLFAAQTKVVRRLAAENDCCVIVGRCSDYILYDDPNSFRIFVHARPDYRAANLAKRHGVSPEEAAAEMRRTDAARARYYENFTGREWGNTKYYNLAIDSGVFGPEASIRLIEDAVELWKTMHNS